MDLVRTTGSLLVRVFLISGTVAILANRSLAADEILIAQITPDNTLGNESSVLTPGVDVRGGPADLIEGGATRNSNLFHSFSDFNVDAGQRVYFANPAGILDIYSRITGGNPSSILGTLGVDGSADLFLINSNGIIFGPDSQLDVAGSFTASTAESIVFSDGGAFSTIDPDAAPILEINVTPGLQYNENSSAVITNQGNLAVGQNLTLGASILSIYGSLIAGQDIILETEISSSANLQINNSQILSNTDAESTDNGGSILITSAENIIINNSLINANTNSEGNAGTITINGTDTVHIDNSSITSEVRQDTAIPNSNFRTACIDLHREG